ncbi:MAG: beta-hydroxyacyl-ACP dehydratase [Ruminococcus sp.]|jgi:3-hydroxyacyl-[acyl-carrier-protein] dehydratase|nr:beta-hydroxyacyl-ACP dehydratase [Ruminococcus sp.]MBP1564308.1 3-hydroxyacyl-ACP dehydratase FabZ [Oscillospiraceae bacterium]
MEILMNKQQIEEIIPHRDPFMLIDEVVEMVPGKSIVARKHIKEDEFWFKGHFPEKPVVPGVLLVEMLAQAGAVSMLSLDEHKGKIGFLGGVDKAKFRRMVVPGDTVTLEVEMIKIKGPVGVGKAVASVDGEKAVTAEISFVLK